MKGKYQFELSDIGAWETIGDRVGFLDFESYLFAGIKDSFDNHEIHVEMGH